MKFALEITLGNDAMQTGEDVARRLEVTAAKIRANYGIDYIDEWNGLGGYVMDANGNTVGKWTVAE